MKARLIRCFAMIIVGVGSITSYCGAQSFPYANGKPLGPNPIGPYTPANVPNPTFANSARTSQLVKDGKLMLSLDDAIALALENNLDLAIARYNLPIADTDILRAKSGTGVRGVATGLVSGTPGGGGVGSTTTTGSQGGGAGGTTSGAGGAGTGTAGIVTSTLGAGPILDSYDPSFNAGMDIEHAKQSQISVLGGAPTLDTNTGVANFSYSQGFPTGTLFTVGYNNLRTTSNSIFTEISPALNLGYRVTFRQHLLSGLSWTSNRRNLIIAKSNREITDVAFRQQVIATVSQIENIYWDLVNAYEDVKVKQRSVELAEKLLGDNQKQVQIGTLAPIEVVRGESQVASAKQDLIISQTNLELQQLLMKNAVSRNLTDTQLQAAEVIPTDTMEIPPVEPVVPTQDLVAEALSHRPELAQSQIDLTNREVTKLAARNGLLPTVDLVGWYGTSAVGGDQNINATCPPNYSEFCVPPGTIQSAGYGNSFNTLFTNEYPDYAVGINVNIPIHNRPAQADQIRSELEYRQAQMRLQQLQNQIRIQVQNSQFALQQNRARVDAARKARDLAQQTLDAEQKKYSLGASTTYAVQAAQRDFSQSESSLVAAMTAYEKSRVDLDSQTGLTLAHLGIEMNDAESGNINHLPNVPGVVPSANRSEVQLQPSPPAQ
ncbi:MAG: TolC family protein [Terriglobales bacterium]|jgi:outer membrane protein TolC